MSFILQAIGGVGNGISIPASMALLSSYKEQRAQFIGYFELIAGLGALVGPLLGSSLYQGMGYKGPFLGLGVIYLVPVLIFAPRIKNLEAKMMNNLVAPAAEDQTLFHEKDEPGEVLVKIRRTRTTGPTSTLAEWSDSSGRAEWANTG